tara:strand:- start:19977 stop:20528 length:552 start_codon:yes stop_codon:yes gene_type:complete
MADTRKVAFLVGSLRSASLNRAAALHAHGFFRDDTAVTTPDLAEIPAFNQDLEASGTPAVVTDLKNEVARSDMVVIFSPEYNYGIPGLLKNAIDWLSRPFQAGSLIGRAVGIVCVSPSSRGGENVREQLLRTCQILTDRTYGTTLGIGGVTELNDGVLPEDATRALDKWMKSFTLYATSQTSL